MKGGERVAIIARRIELRARSGLGVPCEEAERTKGQSHRRKGEGLRGIQEVLWRANDQQVVGEDEEMVVKA